VRWQQKAKEWELKTLKRETIFSGQGSFREKNKNLRMRCLRPHVSFSHTVFEYHLWSALFAIFTHEYVK
jgi:hypothetical protein